MGYESKLYIVEQTKLNYINKTTNENGIDIINNIIGSYDLCKMGNSFNINTIFNKQLEGDFYIGEEIVKEDFYGHPLSYCDDLNVLINELEKSENEEHYRRLNPIIAMLKEFEKSKDQFHKLIVVHFGH